MPKVSLTNPEYQAIQEFLTRKGLPCGVAVTFDDVIAPEDYSEVRSRSEIADFSTQLLPHLTAAIPVCSANMESVTGAEMIVELERLGGVGFMPQTLPPKEKYELLERVRRAECAYHEQPLTVNQKQPRREVEEAAYRYGIFSFIVTDEAGRVIGVLSGRDWLYETDGDKTVADLMGGGKRRPLITAPAHTLPQQAAELLREHRIEKLPLVDEQGRLVGLYTVNGLFYKHKPGNERALRDDRGQFIRVGSIGVGRTFTASHLAHVEAQIERGIIALLIDTARAYSVNTDEAIKAIKKHFPDLPLIVGNVSTPEGAKFLLELGADCIKVGQGPGEACRTREVGVGIPQLTATATCSVIAHRYGKTIITDGGMKNPGHIAHALSAGADAVMLGFMLVGTRESAAVAYLDKYGEHDVLFKDYEGSASFHAQLKRVRRGDLEFIRRPEGVKEKVPVTGTLQERIEDILEGLASRMSYVGARNLAEFREKDVFVLQTRAGLREGIKR